MIEGECANKAVKQKSVALTYALALRAEAIGGMPCDWKRANAAILARWSMAGLERIKTLAWKYIDGTAKP